MTAKLGREWRRTLQIIAARDEATDHDELALELNMQPESLYRALRRLSLPRLSTPPMRNDYEYRYAVKWRWLNGQTLTQIGETMGDSRSRIAGVIRKGKLFGHPARRNLKR